MEHASTTNVTGKTVEVNAVASCDAANHADITYAAAAATEQGKVNITATEGGVTINAVNEASGDNFKTDGMHGIYSVYGIGRNDLPEDRDFPDGGSSHDMGSNRQMFYKGMYDTYMKEKYKGSDEYGVGGRNDQSEVTVRAAGDVNVNVDLGDADYYGAASGITASFGDVKVTSDQGNINVASRLEGGHRGEGNLSALRVDGGGSISLKAEGDVTLRVDANGGNLAVVDVPTNYYKGSYLDQAYKAGDGNVLLSGENVRIEGVAGGDGTAEDNHIAGINLGGSGYKAKQVLFRVDTQEDGIFSIDVTARNNGGATSATAIRVENDSTGPADYMGAYLDVDPDARVEISAQVKADGKPLSLDSHTTGISAHNGFVALTAGSYSPYLQYNPGDLKPLDEVSITVGGARYNTGIEAMADRNPNGDAYASVSIAAKDLDIIVRGGAATGDSSSYGVKATAITSEYGSRTNVLLQSSDLTIEVEDAARAVALHASGTDSKITVTNVNNPITGQEDIPAPLNVYIKASQGISGSMLKGIAVEALNGGYVSIDSLHPSSGSDYGMHDSIVLDGPCGHRRA